MILANPLHREPPMKLRQIMTSPVETVQFDDTAEHAWHCMQARRIHHLLVLDGAQLVGVLSDRDLGGPGGAARRAGKSAGELATPAVVTADAETTVRDAANKLRGHAIGCLPVFDAGRLAGIVTIADLLELLGRRALRPVPEASL
jgi:acetoin utilization protein AcuB